MGVVKKPGEKGLVPHCETLKSGTKVFWADDRYRNWIERIAFEK